MLDFQIARWLVYTQVAQQAGNNHPTSIPTGVFVTRDGKINLSVTGRLIWQRFYQILGEPKFFDHLDFKTEEKRSKNRDILNNLIIGIIKHKSSMFWIDVLNVGGVLCGLIYDSKQSFNDV